MGHKIRQPTTATVLALGGVSIKISPATLVLVLLVVVAWMSVGCLLVAGVENRWVVAASGASCSLTFAAIAFKSVERIGVMLARHADHNGALLGWHADRVETITQAHGKDLRNQVFTLNWLMASQAGGRERAKSDADRMYNGGSPSDSGPFKIPNGA